MANRFMPVLLPVAALFTAIMLWGCTHSDRFVLQATIDGIGAQGVTLTFYADGKVNRLELIPDEKGMVRFVSTAAEPTVAELSLTATGEVLALVPVENGHKIKVSLPLASPLDITVSGYKPAEEMAGFIRNNATVIRNSDFNALNAAIKEFVITNPSSIASTCLMTTRFELEGNTQLADSLINLIDPGARPANIIENFNAVMTFRAKDSLKQPVRAMNLSGVRDSLYAYTPSGQGISLLAFTGSNTSGRDSITRVLGKIAAQYPAKKVRVVEISLNPDSSRWRRQTRGDSARWDHAWVAGSGAALPIEQLHVTRTPFFIVSDSMGRQLYRTPYPSNAARFINTIR